MLIPYNLHYSLRSVASDVAESLQIFFVTLLAFKNGDSLLGTEDCWKGEPPPLICIFNPPLKL